MFGGSKKLKIIGISKMDIKNTPIIFNDATIPNSTRIELCVVINVANPRAVVRLVRNVALPILLITLCKAFILLP